MRHKGFGVTLSCLYIEAQGCVPVLLENFAWYVLFWNLFALWVELGFSVGMEAFDELLLLNVP